MAKEKAEEKVTEEHYSKVRDKIDMSILNARRLFLCDAIDGELVQDLIEKLWYLELQEPKKPILLVINSPGGSVDAGFALWDQIKMISSPVKTLVTGLAASMGSILSLVADKGSRFATPNARIMIHQPMIGGVIRGQATDLEIQAKEILKTRSLIVDMYVLATGKPREVIEDAIDRDKWFSAKEALDFGLLDGIVDSYAKL
jgi:ATP-dependent Clp protease protease subunit